MVRTYLSAFSLLVALLFFSNCSRDAIEGTGSVVTETRLGLRDFDGLILESNCEVRLIQNSSFKVEVEGYESLMPFVETFVSQGRLVVRLDPNFRYRHNNIILYISAPDLWDITNTGSGKICTSGRHDFGSELRVINSGSGDVILRGDTEFANMTISGSGDIELDGDGEELEATLSGSGDLEAFGFNTSKANVHLTGSGYAKLDVFRLLEVWISGSGNVVYEGSPRVVANITGSGQVRRR